MRILVTGVGGPAGGSLAAQLARRGVWVGGVDLRMIDMDCLDEFRTVPAAGDPGCLRALADLAEAWQVDAVIPTVSEELVTVSAETTAVGVPVLVAAAGPVAVANDKYWTAQCLAAAGVPVPKFAVPSRFPDPASAVGALGGPVVVKPRVSRGGRDVRVIDAAAARTPTVRAWWARLSDAWIVQRFAPGVEYAPVVFRSGAPSRPPVCVVLEKVGLREGVTGNAVAVRRPPAGDPVAARVAEVARRGAAAAGLTGPVDIDIRIDADGQPVVLEINARFGANSAAAPELLDAALDDLAESAAVPAARR